MINKEYRITAKEFAVIESLKAIGRIIMAIRFDNNRIIVEYKESSKGKSKYLDITNER